MNNSLVKVDSALGSNWSPHGSAAIEALRLGVVNHYVSRHMTYGRDEEIAALESKIESHPGGSCQIVVGDYGSGKTHLCAVLCERFQNDKYAVAHLEMGSSSGRAENPDAVLDAVCRSLCLRVDGLHLRGATDIYCWLRSVKAPDRVWGWEHEFLSTLHRANPGRKNVSKRFAEIKSRYLVEFESQDFSRLLVRKIPTPMTACNLAVARLNELAHTLRENGVKGLVILLDEAERSNWSTSNYRLERSRNMILGLGLAAANLDTSGLGHYGNDKRSPYCPESPSLIHAVFFFSFKFGLAAELAQLTGEEILDVEPLGTPALSKIRKRIAQLHTATYAWSIDPKKYDALVPFGAKGHEARSMIRAIVAALDFARFHNDE